MAIDWNSPAALFASEMAESVMDDLDFFPVPAFVARPRPEPVQLEELPLAA